MRQRIFLVMGLVMATWVTGRAQSSCTRLMQEGKRLETAAPKPDYEGALKKYMTVMIMCPEQIDSAQVHIQEIFRKIDQMRKDAEAARRRADQSLNSERQSRMQAYYAQSVAEMARAEADSAKNRAERELRRNERLIDALFFYEDSLALGYNGFVYGYINPQGEPLIPFRYEQAAPFKYPGIAIVSTGGNVQELVTTSGNTYRYSTQSLLLAAEQLGPTQFQLYLNSLSPRRKRRFLRKTPRIYQKLAQDTLKTPAAPPYQALIRSSLNLSETLFFEPLAAELRVLVIESFEPDTWDNEEGADTDAPEQLWHSLEKLKHLEILSMQGASGGLGTAEIQNLPELKRLVLTQCRLTEIPPALGSLRHLLLLDLCMNQLDSLPDSLRYLSTLRHFNVSYNRLRELPAGFADWSHMQYVNVGGNLLETFPEAVWSLRNLEELYLFRNKLSVVPDHFTRLPQLRKLSLSMNALRELPPSLCALHQVHTLYADHNQLTAVPAQMHTMEELRTLDISFNQIAVFPEDLLLCKHLEWLSIGYNPCSDTPEEQAQIRARMQAAVPGCIVFFGDTGWTPNDVPAIRSAPQR